jgi:hypothetical protein
VGRVKRNAGYPVGTLVVIELIGKSARASADRDVDRRPLRAAPIPLSCHPPRRKSVILESVPGKYDRVPKGPSISYSR